MKKILSIILCIALTLMSACTFKAQASEYWPEPQDIKAGAGIVIDGDTGAVLYGKNIHQQCYPASITKILTALIVIENCNLEDEFTFSNRAIYDVEENSQNAGYLEGDTVSVRDALYALLLQSANEVANGLAEHCSGSIEAFVEEMNAYAEKLGCKDTHFANPSGLNNEEHYTTAYDFALISKAAFENPTFCMIDGTTYYNLPPMKRLPDGYEIYTHHSMIKKSNSLHYDGAIGGKTGYTSLAGNTLVTAAERDGMKLIAVILDGQQTHYEDTKILLDFGFANFKSIKLNEYDNKYDKVFDVLDITGTGIMGRDALYTNPDAKITLPNDAAISDTISSISYGITASDPEDAIAKIIYTYDERFIGSNYIFGKYVASESEIVIDETELEAPEEVPIVDAAKGKVEGFVESLPAWAKITAICTGGLIILLIITLIILHFVNKKKNEMKVDVSSYRGRSRKRK